MGGVYTLERELGGGGMSRVFLAEEIALGRRIVIKLLPPELAHAVSAERFRQEIRLAAGLQHPFIVPVLSAGEAAGLLYYTMPFVEGQSLRGRLGRAGELPVREALRVLRDVAAALAYAHEHGVVHRDIKPENVLLAAGEALVTDFGVAKAISAAATGGDSSGLTSLGVALGTPAYMAPEQAAADPFVDHRADLYAWGGLAYELLTGQPPFIGRTPAALLAAHAIESPEPIQRRRPALPPPLAALVMRCLEKRPADRPQSATEVLQTLELVETTPSGGMNPTAVTPASTNRSPSARRWLRLPLVAAAGAVVAAVLLGYSVLGPGRGLVPAAQPKATDSEQLRSVAVLPFANLSSDRENEYFSDGMTDELITALGKVEGLRVPARSSAFAFKGKATSLSDVGEKLNVGAVLEGSVRRAGGRLRVTAQLVSVRDGYQLWGESYDRGLQDVFAVQDEIARAIVTALKVKLAGSDTAPLVRPSTVDLSALDLYLRGRSLWAKRGHENLERAVVLFQQAIAKDSGFARAYAALADTYVIIPDWSDVDPGPYYAKADSAAWRALALDTSLAEPHAALGYRAARVGRLSEATEAFRRALRLNPAYANGLKWYGNHLQWSGDYAGGHEMYAAARRLDPLSTIIWINQGQLYVIQRRFGDAQRECSAVLATDSSNVAARICLAETNLGLGRLSEAQRHAEWLRHGVARHVGLGLLVAVRARAGDSAGARMLLEGLVKSASADTTAHTWVHVLAYAAVGEGDSALAWLERRRRLRFLSPAAFLHPLLDPLRADPRFAELERRVRLDTRARLGSP